MSILKKLVHFTYTIALYKNVIFPQNFHMRLDITFNLNQQTNFISLLSDTLITFQQEYNASNYTQERNFI